jgi:hypothetical protein
MYRRRTSSLLAALLAASVVVAPVLPRTAFAQPEDPREVEVSETARTLNLSGQSVTPQEVPGETPQQFGAAPDHPGEPRDAPRARPGRGRYRWLLFPAIGGLLAGIGLALWQPGSPVKLDDAASTPRAGVVATPRPPDPAGTPGAEVRQKPRPSQPEVPAEPIESSPPLVTRAPAPAPVYERAGELAPLFLTSAALKEWDPGHVFPFEVHAQGPLEKDGDLDGNIIIRGVFPGMGVQEAIVLADALGKQGIRHVKGALIVTPDFVFGNHPPGEESARALRAALDSRQWDEVTRRTYAAAPQLEFREDPRISQFDAAINDRGEDPRHQQVALDELRLRPLSELLLEMNASSAGMSDPIAQVLLSKLGGGAGVLQRCCSGELVAPEVQVRESELYLQAREALALDLSRSLHVTPRGLELVVAELAASLQARGHGPGDVFLLSGRDPAVASYRLPPGVAILGSERGRMLAVVAKEGGATSVVVVPSGELAGRVTQLTQDGTYTPLQRRGAATIQIRRSTPHAAAAQRATVARLPSSPMALSRLSSTQWRAGGLGRTVRAQLTLGRPGVLGKVLLFVPGRR